MKVLHVNYSKIGGAGRACRAIGELVEANHKIDAEYLFKIDSSLKANPFLDPTTSVLTLLDNYVIKSAKFSGMYSFFRSNSQKNTLKKINNFPGIIHLHWINGVISLSDVQKLLKINKKIVWTMHDLNQITGGCHTNNGCENYIDSNCINCPAVKKIFKKLPIIQNQKIKKFWQNNNNLSVVFPSEQIKKIYLKSNSLNSINHHVIPNPLRQIFYQNNEIQDTHNKIIKVGFVAEDTNDPQKNIKFLIDCLSNITIKNNTDIEIVIIGKKYQGKIENKKIIRTDFRSTKNDDELIRIIKTLDLLAVTSGFESFGYTTAEVATFGIPSVIFSGNAASEYILDGESGLIAANEKEFYQNLEALILDSRLRKKLGMVVKKDIKKYLDPTAIATKYLKIYQT